MTTEDVRLILAASQWTEIWEGDQVAMEKEFSVAKDGQSKGSGAVGKRRDEPKKEEMMPAEFIFKFILVL